ncbi:hypothetical protein S83_034726, partial [Arachis hypogaea]
ENVGWNKAMALQTIVDNFIINILSWNQKVQKTKSNRKPTYYYWTSFCCRISQAARESHAPPCTLINT